MEPILLYGFPAGSSMGLVAAFEQVGQPYRLCRVDMLADMKNAAYARLNGRQETPVLGIDDGHGGRVVTETMAIATWLEARDEARRISFDPRSAEADRMHQLMAFVNSSFTGAFSPLWSALELSPPDPARQAHLRAYGRADVLQRHEHLEAMIGEGAFLVGDRLSLADTTLIGVARWAEYHEAIDAAAYPRLAALRRRIEAHPAVQYAQAIEEGQAPAGTGACKGHVALAEVLERFGG
jgi:glutathione S-transferase